MPHYSRRPLHVEAWQLNATDWDTCHHIAQWAGATLLPHHDYLTFSDGIILVLGDEYGRHTDWIVRDHTRHHHILTNDAFHDLFLEHP